VQRQSSSLILKFSHTQKTDILAFFFVRRKPREEVVQILQDANLLANSPGYSPQKDKLHGAKTPLSFSLTTSPIVLFSNVNLSLPNLSFSRARLVYVRVSPMRQVVQALILFFKTHLSTSGPRDRMTAEFEHFLWTQLFDFGISVNTAVSNCFEKFRQLDLDPSHFTFSIWSNIVPFSKPESR